MKNFFILTSLMIFTISCTTLTYPTHVIYRNELPPSIFQEEEINHFTEHEFFMVEKACVSYEVDKSPLECRMGVCSAKVKDFKNKSTYVEVPKSIKPGSTVITCYLYKSDTGQKLYEYLYNSK